MQDYLKLFDKELFGIKKPCVQKICFPNNHAMKEFIVKMFVFSFFLFPTLPLSFAYKENQVMHLYILQYLIRQQ